MKKLYIIIIFFVLPFCIAIFIQRDDSKGICQILKESQPADVYEIHNLMRVNFPGSIYSKEGNGVFADRIERLEMFFNKPNSYVEIRQGSPIFCLEITAVEVESRLFAQVNYFYLRLYFNSEQKFLGYDVDPGRGHLKTLVLLEV